MYGMCDVYVCCIMLLNKNHKTTNIDSILNNGYSLARPKTTGLVTVTAECLAVSNIDNEIFFLKMPNFHQRLFDKNRPYVAVFVKFMKLVEFLS